MGSRHRQDGSGPRERQLLGGRDQEDAEPPGEGRRNPMRGRIRKRALSVRWLFCVGPGVKPEAQPKRNPPKSPQGNTQYTQTHPCCCMFSPGKPWHWGCRHHARGKGWDHGVRQRLPPALLPRSAGLCMDTQTDCGQTLAIVTMSTRRAKCKLCQSGPRAGSS
jgi:hypothetical protein